MHLGGLVEQVPGLALVEAPHQLVSIVIRESTIGNGGSGVGLQRRLALSV